MAGTPGSSSPHRSWITAEIPAGIAGSSVVILLCGYVSVAQFFAMRGPVNHVSRLDSAFSRHLRSQGFYFPQRKQRISVRQTDCSKKKNLIAASRSHFVIISRLSVHPRVVSCREAFVRRHTVVAQPVENGQKRIAYDELSKHDGRCLFFFGGGGRETAYSSTGIPCD